MLKELFEKNPNIVINTDIDGFLCGIILQKYYGCRVVGFSNSWDCVWLDPAYEENTPNALYSPVYIDLFVANPDVYCIEQHIIGYDESHNQQIAALSTKINPNIMREGRSFTGDYFHKYPFGTVHFLITLMGREGIEVDLPCLDNRVGLAANYGLTVGDIVLRADDALFSSLGPYKENTVEWWPWLQKYSKYATAINSMIIYIDKVDPKTRFDVKNRTGEFFVKEFKCSGIDGAFKYITDENGNLPDNVLLYRNEICQLIKMPILELPNKYNIHKGIASTTKLNISVKDRLLKNNPVLYSYAFIYGQHSRYNNFSYTVNMI